MSEPKKSGTNVTVIGDESKIMHNDEFKSALSSVLLFLELAILRYNLFSLFKIVGLHIKCWTSNTSNSFSFNRITS